MNKEQCLDMIKYYHDLIYKVLLGIGAAVVTIMGVAFSTKNAFYIFIAFWLMSISCILFLYAKSKIAYFWIYMYLLEPDVKALMFIKIFLRCDHIRAIALENILRKMEALTITHVELKQEISKLVVPKKIPLYFGTYPALFWTSAILFSLIFITYSLGWALF